ncbi:MAG: cupin domain-containing protein [Silicimonas sp.]|nr:cupin domain-containing protein [Silicimonas sp.]
MRDLSDDTGWINWLGVRYRTILQTPAMSIVDTASPAGSGPPRHVHDDADETFVMVEGRIELWIDGVTSFVDAGEAATVPRGAEHTFRVTDDGPARKLVILAPGGFEGFFADMAAGQFRIPEDMAQIGESAARHHLRFTGPPL